MGLPVEFSYLVLLLVVIVVLFVFLKRPIYEAMLVGFILMVFVLGKQEKIFIYLLEPSTNSLFYAIVGFLSLAYIFSASPAVDYVLDFIVALVGRFRGGAGWVSLISSTFMAALSGSGPGNVAADGVFTIPAMIKSGFPRALAATTEMAASSLGPIIPPSGTILLAFGVLDILYPGQYPFSAFWLAVIGVGLWFIVQRAISLYIFIRYYKVEPIPQEEIPDLRETVKKGWKALLIPVIILVPFILDFALKDTFFTARLGVEGANALSNSILLFTPGVSAIYTLLISKNDLEGGLALPNLVKFFRKGVRRIVPVAATVYFAYALSGLFKDVSIGTNIGLWFQTLEMPFWQVVIFFPLFTTFLGMFIPGSSQIAIFGSAIVSSLVFAGVNPLLAAAILPAITSALEGMTPPLALAMYTAMGIAQSGMKETSLSAMTWVLAHLVTAILIMLGLLPVLFI